MAREIGARFAAAEAIETIAHRLTPFGVALLGQALVFGNPKRERGTESRLIVPRSRVGLPKKRNCKTHDTTLAGGVSHQRKLPCSTTKKRRCRCIGAIRN